MLYYIFIILLSIGTIYNLIKRTELIYLAEVTISHYISLVILVLMIGYVLIYVLPYNSLNYLIAIVAILFTYSGFLSRGFNRRGIYNTSFITFLAKFSKWTEVTDLSIEYNVDDYIDITVATELRAFKQRYDEKYEDVILKIKKEMKI